MSAPDLGRPSPCEEWFLIQSRLPLGERARSRTCGSSMAVMWRFRTSRPWRDLLAECGPWSTIWDGFRSWARVAP
ncbi:transposase [Nonomuraea indica]|uniref:Transposase n=1 Tax=Nonomuraea indica TaxID=1581193 RepID=A0ABW8A8V8_9ACTN